MNEEQRAQEFIQSIKQLFGRDGTGKIIYQNLKETYQDRSSFDSDPLRMAYKEGQRSIFLDIQSIVEARND